LAIDYIFLAITVSIIFSIRVCYCSFTLSDFVPMIRIGVC